MSAITGLKDDKASRGPARRMSLLLQLALAAECQHICAVQSSGVHFSAWSHTSFVVILGPASFTLGALWGGGWVWQPQLVVERRPLDRGASRPRLAGYRTE